MVVENINFTTAPKNPEKFETWFIKSIKEHVKYPISYLFAKIEGKRSFIHGDNALFWNANLRAAFNLARIKMQPLFFTHKREGSILMCYYDGKYIHLIEESAKGVMLFKLRTRTLQLMHSQIPLKICASHSEKKILTSILLKLYDTKKIVSGNCYATMDIEDIIKSMNDSEIKLPDGLRLYGFF